MDNSLQKYIIVLLYIWVFIKIEFIEDITLFGQFMKIYLLTTICLLILHALANLIIIICNKRGIYFSILFGHYQLAPYQLDEYQQKHRNGYETDGYLEDSDEE